MKICDVTQFYSPRSGGVKRYLHEKIAYVQRHSPGDEHVLIVPGPRSEMLESERARIYTIAAPMVSRATQYRALLNLRSVEEIIEREQPEIIENADPYQLGWGISRIAKRRRTPAVAFYHSDFAEAYLRPITTALGERFTATGMRAAASYTRALYNRFEATFVASEPLAVHLRAIGVQDVHVSPLGVDTDIFNPAPYDAAATRAAHNIPADRTVLLYVGRLAPEKNTRTLFEAFALLTARDAGAFHLIVVGDGQQREQLRELEATTGAVTWLPYCAGSAELAQLYRLADLFVHPGTQETFGLAALESQACGTPVVGIRGSAMDRIILHDQEAWATEAIPAALAAAIERITRTDFAALGASAAVAVAERYAWPRVFDGLFRVYREVCRGYRATGG